MLITIGTIKILIITRKSYIQNGTVIVNIDKKYAPVIATNSIGLMQHANSGIGMGNVSIGTDGNVSINSYEYNEQIRGGPFILVW